MKKQSEPVNEMERDFPRSLGGPAECERRRGMLHTGHMAPLTEYVEGLRRMGKGEVPDFDPMDGGVNARVLFLFEKPGPMTSRSRFISRGNDDPTAEAIFRFAARAGIAREISVLWNIIPWWNETRRVTAHEIKDGEANLAELIRFLPALAGVILVGRRAGRARKYVEAAGLPVVASFHPSPLVKARTPDRWKEIPSIWATIWELVPMCSER